MGPDLAARRLADLDELNRLHNAIEGVTDLNALKPIFYRLEEITRLYPDDAAIHSAASGVRARLVSHGQRLVDAEYSTQSLPLPLPPPPPPLAEPKKVGPAPILFNWKRAVAVGAAVGGLIFSGIVYSVHQNREKALDPMNGPSFLEVKTNPPGATIRIGADEKCKANCKLELPPGSYQVQAQLAGYESAISTVTVEKGTPAALEFNLVAVAPSIRFYTELQSGKVFLDDAVAGDLAEGQYTIEKAPAGKHVVKVVSQSGETSLVYEMEAGKMPRVSGPITARNMITFAVANAGGTTKIWSSAASLKASLDSTSNGTVDANGLEFQNIAPGEHDLVLADGPDQRKIVLTIGQQPALTIFVKLDLNLGTIIVSTGEDGVTVSSTSRPLLGKTTRGQLRLGGVPVGEYTLKVAKDGFEPVEPQKVIVKKGDEVKVAFKLRQLPKFAALHVRGAAPGTTILVDGQTVGSIAADGAFSISNVAPGDRAIELRRAGGYTAKRLTRPFRAGEAIDLSGADVLLEKAAGGIRLAVTPPDARLTIKRSDEAQSRNISAGAVSLTEGIYNITARAANYMEKTVTVQIAPGENKPVEIALARMAAAPTPVAPPPVKIGTMANWDAPGEWWIEEGISLHRVGNPTYAMTPAAGTWSFDFILKKGKVLKWFFDYQDSKNSIFYQLDPKKDFSRKDGKGAEFRIAHGLPLSEEPHRYQIQVDVSHTAIVTRVNGRILDTLTPGRDPSVGKFGLQIPRADTFGLANFRFQPRP